MAPIKKVYGDYRIERCFFCDKQATTRTNEKMPACLTHKTESASNLHCACKRLLEPMQGKFGTFFLCPSCGPQTVKKVREMNG